MRLKDKVAIITGVGAGIGKATALLFAKEGAKLLLTDFDAKTGEQTASEAKDLGVQIHFVRADVSSEDDCRKMTEAAVNQNGRLDILCNIAGIVVGGTLDQTSDQDWNKSMDVNLRSIYLTSKYAIPHFRRAGGGSIVNMASVAGLMGVKNRAAYSASKGGVIALTKSMALDYVEDKIRVNCICPGTVETPSLAQRLGATGDLETARREFTARQPMKRFGRPEEIAFAALYLASDESSFVTGIELIVDGGMSL